MHFTTVIATLSLFIVSAFAAASVEADHFDISLIKVDRVVGGNFTLSFTIHDPDPLTNATSECTGVWKQGSKDYPQGSYAICPNSTFGWNMAAFTNYQKFTLGLQHHFKDPSIGDPPYDSVTTYGKLNVTKKELGCKLDGTHATCEQTPATLQAPIYAVSA